MLLYDTWKFRMIALSLALLENCAVTGMMELSTRLIHRDWQVINIPDGSQMDTNEKLFGAVWYYRSLSLSLSLSLSPFSLLSSFVVTLPSMHSTILIYKAVLIWRDTDSKRWSTGLQADTVLCVCARACVLKQLHMSVWDGQKLGVSSSVSVRVKFFIYTVKCPGWGTVSGTSPAAMLIDRWRLYKVICGDGTTLK